MRRLKSWAAALLLQVCLAPFEGVAAPPQSTVVMIAGLLGGNTLVPLGQYSKERWTRAWPQPDEEVDRKIRRVQDLPPSWSSGRLPTEWFLWSENVHGAPVRVGQPVLGEAHCQAVWGMSTRLQPFGHETTAIATNVQSGVQPFDRSTLAAGTYPRLGDFLNAQAGSAAAAAVQPKRSDGTSVSTRLPDCDPAYELYCVSTGKVDEELCSFEASWVLKTGLPEPEPGCSQIAVVQGWFASSAGVFTPMHAKATFTDCDAIDHRTWVPLVLIAADARTFVVVREHGYEDETFSVLEVRDRRLEEVLKVAGGGC